MPHLRSVPNPCATRGGTLVEVMIAIVVALLVGIVAWAFYAGQERAMIWQRQISVMEDQGRTAARTMIARLAEAGLDPNETGGGFSFLPTLTVGGTPETLSATTILYRYDRNGNNVTEPGAGEVRGFKFQGNILWTITPSGGGVRWERLSTAIDSVTFSYFDVTGTTVPTSAPNNIHRVNVVVVARTERSDPKWTGAGGYRRHTFNVDILARNRAYAAIPP